MDGLPSIPNSQLSIILMNSTNITFSLLEKIERANSDFCLFDGCKKILVGLSGGADSTSLVHALCKLSEKYGFEIIALHVNHMIRENEADRDEEFARSLCEKLKVEFLCERVDIPSLSKENGVSLELCARDARYEIFSRVCKDRGITHVATAHNACDNSETLIFNLVRGTGIKGLCGIPPKRPLCDGVMLIRPLIYAERHEIEKYLSDMGQSFVTDSTNSDTDYTRNFIRCKILPLLREINPSLEESMARTARLHRSDEEYLMTASKQCYTDSIEELSALHESMLSRVVMEMFSTVSNETLPEYHVRKLCRMIYEYDGTKTSMSFPDSMSARLQNGCLSFKKDKRCACRTIKHFCRDVSDFGEIFFEENPYALYISLDQNEDIPQTLVNNRIVYKKYTTDYLYFDTIPFVLHVRNRREGDKITNGKMNKSIKKLMSSSRFDEDERYLVPFVCEDEKILLVPSLAVCDECKEGHERKQRISVSLYVRQ